MGLGKDRNNLCHCGSGIKSKLCSRKNHEATQDSEPVPQRVLDYFSALKLDAGFLESLGIYQTHQGTTIRTEDGYRVSLGNGLFKITSGEMLNFYELLGVIAMDTLGDDWINDQGKKSAEDRSDIYKTISLLGATGTFEKIISYEGTKVGSVSIPESGFSKSFLTLSYDIFCLRNRGFLPESLINRLKQHDQYQGARYEISIAAIFCRLGYKIEWFDDKKEKGTRPEFVAIKDEERIYVEVKSRHLQGVHNTSGQFSPLKAKKSKGWVSLVNAALKKKVPKGYPFVIFIDMNAVEDSQAELPKWLEEVKSAEVEKKLQLNPSTKCPFTAIFFTNYAYHYQGFEYAKQTSGAIYESNSSERPYQSLLQKFKLHKGTRHYGFIPDYQIQPRMTVLQSESEYPSINNIPKLHNL